MKKLLKYTAPALLSLMLLGCRKDYLDTNPTNQAKIETVFTSVDGAQVALDGLYRLHYESLWTHETFGQKSYDLGSDLMGNDMVIHSAGYNWFNGYYNFTATPLATTTSRSYYIWKYYYQLIFNANSILDNIDKAIGDSSAKENIKGQVLGVRAFSYFNLINFFQQTYKGSESKPGVPLYTTAATTGQPRGTVQDVYTQILKDLTDAEKLLTDKARRDLSNIDISVVQGIRARVALQMEDYAAAATYANKARQGYSLMTNADYQAGFSSVDNPEWMWGMQVITDQATIYASFFSHMDVATGGYAALGGQKKITKDLYDKIKAGDIRKTVFRKPGTGTSSYPDYCQTKFHVPTPGSWAGDYLFIRVAEMYLIEAEGLARTGNDGDAAKVLNALIKNRYTAYDASALSGESLISEILLQRRIELWGEGLSLLDIKRLKQGLNRLTGPGNHGAPNFNPGVYTMPDQDTRFIFRIPQDELNANKSMTAADQNP